MGRIIAGLFGRGLTGSGTRAVRGLPVDGTFVCKSMSRYGEVNRGDLGGAQEGKKMC